MLQIYTFMQQYNKLKNFEMKKKTRLRLNIKYEKNNGILNNPFKER